MESLICSMVGILSGWDTCLFLSPQEKSPSLSWPHVPSLEPLADATTEDEADPMDGLPTGLECFPPRPGGFRPLGFCMVVPLGGQTKADHILSAILGHLRTKHKRDGVMMFSLRPWPVPVVQKLTQPHQRMPIFPFCFV